MHRLHLRALLILGLSVILPVVAGCGGGGGAPAGPGPLHPTVQAADAASDRFQQLCRDDEWPSGAADFLDYVLTLDEVEAAELCDDTDYCTVLYRSGVVHLFYCPPASVIEPEAYVATARCEEAAPVQTRGFPDQSHPSASAAVLHTGSGRDASTARSSCLQILDAFVAGGYIAPAAPADPTVDWFSDWDHYGMIYLSGHAGMGRVPGSTERFHGIFTSTPYSPSGIEGTPYEDDLDARRLLYSTSPRYRNLVVTARFFDYHYRVGHPDNPSARALPRSIIYLDTCHTLDDTTDPDAIPATLCNCGAEMVLGWDGRCQVRTAAQTAALFFDRLCGLSDVEAGSLNPPTRPFTALQVYDHLETAGRTRRGADHLVHLRRADAGAQTAACPVISGGYFLTAVPAGGVAPPSGPTVYLTGYFGTTAGQVLVGGRPATVQLWEADRILAEVPASGTGSVGDVRVRVNNLTSNDMRLTRFNGTANWTVNRAGEYSGTITANYNGRVLLQRMRAEVDGPATTADGPWGACWMFAEYGQVSWTLAGDWTDGEGRQHHLVANGTAPVLPQRPSGPTPYMHCHVVFDLDADPPTYELLLMAQVTGTDTVTEPDTTTHDEPWLSAGYGHAAFTAPQTLPATWIIPAGTYSGTDFNMTYSNITPHSPPDPTYPAMAAHLSGNASRN